MRGRGPMAPARRAVDGGATSLRRARGAVGAVFPALPARVQDAVTAGLIAAATSGVPSTLVTLARGEAVLDGARAAGAMVLPRETRTVPLLAAAVPVHLLLSVGWAVMLERTLPPGRELWGGLAGGLAVAALDLGVIGRRLPAIASLPQPRQWADHVAYGLTVGAVVAQLRS